MRVITKIRKDWFQSLNASYDSRDHSHIPVHWKHLNFSHLDGEKWLLPL